MRKISLILAAFALLAAGWFGAWHYFMRADVARVKASIAHHDRAIKAVRRHMALKAERVYPAGFPFQFRVGVDRLTLTEIDGMQSYALSLPRIELAKTDAAQGRYRVIAPDRFDAMYSENGQSPERYHVVLSEVPEIVLRAQADSRQCPGLPGSKPCAAVAEGAPLLSYAVKLPRALTLDVTLDGASKPIGFEFIPLNGPMFRAIPADASNPLQLFVGLLREAMVFSK